MFFFKKNKPIENVQPVNEVTMSHNSQNHFIELTQHSGKICIRESSIDYIQSIGKNETCIGMKNGISTIVSESYEDVCKQFFGNDEDEDDDDDDDDEDDDEDDEDDEGDDDLNDWDDWDEDADDDDNWDDDDDDEE